MGLVVPRVAVEGLVEFTPHKGKVRGGGSWVIFDNAVAAPKPILGGGTLFGTWEAEEIVTFIDGFGTFGRIEASILELLISLQLDGNGTGLEGLLRLICNIGPAGISTGEPEGYHLTVPGLGFGTFNPLTPAVGLTHISVPE